MNPTGYAFLGLTAIVAMLVGVLTYAFLRFAAAARNTKEHLRESGTETALLSAALQDAVSKLKAQERAMSARAEASEELSGQIVASLTAGLLVVDSNGRIEILNPAGCRMLEITEDPRDQDYRRVLHAAPELVAVLAECLASSRPIVRRSVRVAGSGRGSYFGLTVSPLRSGDTSSGAICLFSDLTTVMELEEQLRLKETLARLGELTAGIAHEFRNGLATIHGYSRLIDPEALPTQYGPYVEGIRQEADALGKVVTNFLNFARPEQVALIPVDLEAIARRAADDLLRELPDGGHVDVTGSFAGIEGDEVLLRQAFANLLRNAAEACSTAGRVPVISIRGHVDGGRRFCRVVVDDNGTGIPAGSRDRIFQPFFTTRSRGTGLGLAIVQKVVVMHNGRIAVRESAAGGASFELAFPLSAAHFQNSYQA
ncbi:MAG TPA: ATP-binding protein [Vicinamibacterales bacterium]|nr:ATP-binding protein [Vicinamibacterales bacterium]